MSLDEQIRRVSAERKIKHVKAYAESSKKKLEASTKKRMTTIMIGSLSKFEDQFSQLWGQGKPEEELTEEEKWWKDLWDKTRNEILTNGNNQIRGLINDLEQYDVNWEKYRMTLPVKGLNIERSY